MLLGLARPVLLPISGITNNKHICLTCGGSVLELTEDHLLKHSGTFPPANLSLNGDGKMSLNVNLNKTLAQPHAVGEAFIAKALNLLTRTLSGSLISSLRLQALVTKYLVLFVFFIG